MKLDAWAISSFFLFFFCECLGFLIHSHVTYGMSCHARGYSRASRTCDLRNTMTRQRSLKLFFPPNPLASSLTLLWTITRFLDPFYIFSISQSDSRLYHTQPFLPWVLRVWESNFYSQAFFTLHFLYLAKRRIFLGVIRILSMYLSLHT